MSFLPYSGGGTGGWIGAFAASGLAHVGIVAGLIGLQSQILELAELQNEEASFDVAVALDQLRTDLLSEVIEQETPEAADAETLEDVAATEELEAEAEPEVVEEVEPETIEETQVEEEPPVEEIPEEEPVEETPEELAEEVETETAEDATTAEEAREAEIAEQIAELEPEEIAPAEAEAADITEVEAEPVEAETVEAETVEAEPVEAEPVETETVEAETLDLEPAEAETLEAGPIETVEAPTAAEPVETVVATPLAITPLAEEDPGGLSPIAPDISDIRTVTLGATDEGGIEGGFAIDAVEPVVPVAPEPPAGGGATVADGGETITGIDAGSGLAEAAPVVPLDTPVVGVLDPQESLGEIETASVDTTVTALPEPPLTETAPPVGTPEVTAIGEVGAVEDATSAATGDGSTAPVAGSVFQLPPPTTQELQLTDLILRVRETEAGSCVAALPQRVGSDGIGLALIGDSVAAMTTFSDAFTTAADTELTQSQALLDPRQCAAVSYVRNSVDYPASRLGLTLESEVVASGETLAGLMRGVPGRNHVILLIDDNGVVQDLSRFTAQSGDLFRFEVPVTRFDDARETRQMILALGFAGDVSSIEQLSGQLAETVFAALPQGGDMAVATFDIR